jgi:hypothetical protein
MFSVGLLSMLTGFVLGTRFRVLILFPAMMIACAVVALWVGGRDALGWAVFVMLVAATALQAGYLVGVTRAVLGGRARRPKAAHRFLRAAG